MCGIVKWYKLKVLHLITDKEIMTKIDVKDVLKKAKKKPAREKVSFTFDSEVYKKFQEKCDKNKVAMSRVIEELMLQFIEG